MDTSMTIAVDLAKSVFEIALADIDWRIVERHRLSRAQFQQFFFNRETATVVMEACGTAHFWGRWLTGLGFTVRLIPAHYARAYRRRNKNDAADAAALVEAARCAEIIDVPVKSSEQQMATVERQLQQYAKASADVQAVQQVPGIGLLTATALVAAVAFPNVGIATCECY